MWAKIVAVVVKIVGKLAKKYENFRDLLFAVILLPLMIILLIVLILIMTASAVAQFNNQALGFLFGGVALPATLPSTVISYYTSMGNMFGGLTSAWDSIISGDEDEDSDDEEDDEDDDGDDEEDDGEDDERPDYSQLTDLSERELLMKLAFYSLYYDREEDSFTEEDYLRFATYFADGETVPDMFDELYEGEGIEAGSIDKEKFIEMWNHSYSYAIDWGEEGTSVEWNGWNEGKLTRTVFFEEGEIGPMVVQYAMTRLGDPYSPQMRGQGNYVDCSYLTMWAYAQVGITIPAVEGPQAQWMYDNGLEITYDQLQPGDLIFWSYKPWNSFRSITHTGIYAGDGMVIHASSGQKKVVLVPLFDKDKIKMYGRPY